MAKALRNKRAGSIVWAIVLLLMLGLGGFGVTNFGGSNQAVATVGDREVTVNEYFRALRAEMSAMGAQTGQAVTLAQAQAMGLDAAVRGRLMAWAAMDDEAARMGVSAGDAQVRDALVQADAFKGLNGQFDRQTYQMVLRQQGMNEGDFENKIRDEAARGLLQGAVVGGVSASPVLPDTIVAWAGERRGFRHVTLDETYLPAPIPAPTQDDLVAFHRDHPQAFTAPEARVIDYVWLSPDQLAPSIPLDDAALRAEYDRRRDEFNQPERRLVERLVFSDEAEAARAKARLDAGAVSFEQLAAERGLDLTDIDLGEQSLAELGAAGAAIFALENPGVVGPLPSALGPALYAMNGVLAAQAISFEAARDDLAAEVRLDLARRQITERAVALEDELAGGATLEELAQDQGLTLGQIALDADSSDGIAGYEEFRSRALAATPDDFPEVFGLSDGGLAALALREIRPPALRPLADLRDQVGAAWRQVQVTAALLAMGEDLAAAADFDTAAGALMAPVTVVAPLRRDAFLEDLPEGAVPALFGLTPETPARALEGAEGKVAVIRLDSIAPADLTGPDEQMLRNQLRSQVVQSLGQDVLELYARSLEAKAQIRINQGAINGVHAQMQ